MNIDFLSVVMSKISLLPDEAKLSFLDKIVKLSGLTDNDDDFVSPDINNDLINPKRNVPQKGSLSISGSLKKEQIVLADTAIDLTLSGNKNAADKIIEDFDRNPNHTSDEKVFFKKYILRKILAVGITNTTDTVPVDEYLSRDSSSIMSLIREINSNVSLNVHPIVVESMIKEDSKAKSLFMDSRKKSKKTRMHSPLKKSTLGSLMDSIAQAVNTPGFKYFEEVPSNRVLFEYYFLFPEDLPINVVEGLKKCTGGSSLDPNTISKCLSKHRDMRIMSLNKTGMESVNLICIQDFLTRVKNKEDNIISFLIRILRRHTNYQIEAKESTKITFEECMTGKPEHGADEENDVTDLVECLEIHEESGEESSETTAKRKTISNIYISYIRYLEEKKLELNLLFSSILSHIEGDSSKYGNLYETLEDIRDSINSTIENEIDLIKSEIDKRRTQKAISIINKLEPDPKTGIVGKDKIVSERKDNIQIDINISIKDIKLLLSSSENIIKGVGVIWMGKPSDLYVPEWSVSTYGATDTAKQTISSAITDYRNGKSSSIIAVLSNKSLRKKMIGNPGGRIGGWYGTNTRGYNKKIDPTTGERVIPHNDIVVKKINSTNDFSSLVSELSSTKDFRAAFDFFLDRTLIGMKKSTGSGEIANFREKMIALVESIHSISPMPPSVYAAGLYLFRIGAKIGAFVIGGSSAIGSVIGGSPSTGSVIDSETTKESSLTWLSTSFLIKMSKYQLR
jgi:hypothetical protein